MELDNALGAQSNLANIVVNSPNEVCEECGSKLFIPAYVLKKISKLVSPTGRDEVMEIPLYVCAKCGAVAPHYKDNSNYGKIIGEENKIKLN